MFKDAGPSTALDCSLKSAQGAAFSQAHSVMPNNCGNSSALSAPLYNSGSKSSCADVAKCGNGQLVAMAHGANPAAWQNQVTSFVSQYSVDASGYGGMVTSAGYGGGVVETPSCKHFNQGIGNGMEGGDPGKSQPHGGSNDEGGRTPGQRWIPKLFSGLGR